MQGGRGRRDVCRCRDRFGGRPILRASLTAAVSSEHLLMMRADAQRTLVLSGERSGTAMQKRSTRFPVQQVLPR
jgi:hypothetical protein